MSIHLAENPFAHATDPPRVCASAARTRYARCRGRLRPGHRAAPAHFARDRRQCPPSRAGTIGCGANLGHREVRSLRHFVFGWGLRGKPAPRASPGNRVACMMSKSNLGGPAMQDPSDRADHYRREGVKCHELAKSAELPFLVDFYRRIAVRYMFMAEEIWGSKRERRRPKDEGCSSRAAVLELVSAHCRRDSGLPCA